MFYNNVVFTKKINVSVKSVKNRFINSYNTLSFYGNQKPGVTRHYPPANKEWKDSVYSYNKTYAKNLPLIDENSSVMVKSYFSFIPKLKKNTKSRRMRMMIRRRSTKKLFVSKPEIKQTSDKALITVYMYDRIRVIFSKNLYLLRKSLLKNSLAFTSFLNSNSFSLSSKILNNVTGFYKRKSSRNSSKKHIYLKKQMYKHRVKPMLYAKNVMLSVYRKKTFLKSLFFFYFMKWALSIFNLKVSLKGEFLITKNETRKVLNIRNKYLTLDKLCKINVILLQYLLAELNKVSVKGNQKIDLNTLFLEFKNKYYVIFMRKYLKRVLLVLRVLSKFNSNKRRYANMVKGLKSLVSKLYSKKVELNLVNLKYLHMNSDNFSEALTTKLKRKKGRLLRVLKKSLKLVKKPRKFSARLDNTNLSFNSSKQLLNNDIKTTLNSIKYKWVTGIRLEAKGRLTRRFTASRAVYKFKYKGNLRNLEYLYNTSYKARSPSVFLLRNQFRPNVQHSFAFSNKRIGSFGIKGWISSI